MRVDIEAISPSSSTRRARAAFAACISRSAICALDFRGRPSSKNSQDLEVALCPVLGLGVDHGQMTQHFAANIAQGNCEIGLSAHFLQILPFSGKLLDHLAVVGDDFSAQNTFTGRPRQLVVEVLVHAAAVPHGEHMHASVLVAEVRDERIACIQRLRQPLDQCPEEIGAGLRRGSLVNQFENSQLPIVGVALLLQHYFGFRAHRDYINAVGGRSD